MSEEEDKIVTIQSLGLLGTYLLTKEGIKLRMDSFFSRANGLAMASYDAHDKDGGGHWCGTCACALGHSTNHPLMPPLPEHFSRGDFIISRYRKTYYPSLNQNNNDSSLWNRVFCCHLSDDLTEAAERCFEVADELAQSIKGEAE